MELGRIYHEIVSRWTHKSIDLIASKIVLNAVGRQSMGIGKIRKVLVLV